MKYYLNYDQFYKLVEHSRIFLNDNNLSTTFAQLDITIFLKSKYNLKYVSVSLNDTNPDLMYGHVEFNSDKDLTLFLLSI